MAGTNSLENLLLAIFIELRAMNELAAEEQGADRDLDDLRADLYAQFGSPGDTLSTEG